MSEDPNTSDIAAKIRALGFMALHQLRMRYTEEYKRPTRSDNREHLTRRVAQALINADPPGDRNARRRVTRALEAALRPRTSRKNRPHDARIPPPGSTLRRLYRGNEIQVRVTRRGFVHEDRTYPSLSAVARAVTGARWNGLLFFGLAARKRRVTHGRCS